MISPTHTISPEWQNENSLRAYPLEDDAHAAAVLPTWLISDLRISCPPTYVKVYVSSAYVSDTLVSVAISGMTESGTIVGLLARTVTRDELEPHRAYSMDRLSDDASGTIAFGEVPAGAQPFRLTFGAKKVIEEVAPGIEAVDYLESTGTQWIDTNYYPDPANFGFHIDSVFINDLSGTRSSNGCWGPTKFNEDSFVFTSNGNYKGKYGTIYKNWRGGDSNQDYSSYTVPGERGQVNVVTLRDGTATAHTVRISSPLVNKDWYFDNVYPSKSSASFILFAIRLGSNGSAAGEFAHMKLYRFKFYEYENVVMDFTPVRFTNELGQTEGAMYDRVSDQLFRNQGTGVFGMGDPHVRYEVDAPIVEAAITRVRAPGVTRIVDRAHGTSATGIIDLSGNSEFRTAVDPSDPHTIVFTLTDTYREIATSVCDATPSKDACGDTPVRTINGVAPTTEETEIGGVTYPAGTILLRFR